MAGRLYVAGLGPGNFALTAPAVAQALEESAVVAGYSGYIALIPSDLLQGKELIQSGMMGEMARCNAALDSAAQGHTVTLVCSGDAGVYALAGLVLELAHARWSGEQAASSVPQIVVLPGIPALASAASLLGAPLTHDFACISLSDLLTSWETIENRIAHALAGDFVLVVYNPRSVKRSWQLTKLLEMTVQTRGEQCVIGLVRQAYRETQRVSLHQAGNFDCTQVDMLSILFVGNSQTRILEGVFWMDTRCMVTPRGYMGKYTADGVRKTE